MPLPQPFQSPKFFSTSPLSLVLTCCRATCDIAAGAACDTVPIWEQKSPATFQLRMHAGGKDLRCFLLPAASCPHVSEKYRRQCRRLYRRYFGGIWAPGFKCVSKYSVTKVRPLSVWAQVAILVNRHTRISLTSDSKILLGILSKETSR